MHAANRILYSGSSGRSKVNSPNTGDLVRDAIKLTTSNEKERLYKNLQVVIIHALSAKIVQRYMNWFSWTSID